MADPSARSELDALVERLHARERLRVWSIVITCYGDAVAPRGGVFWLGALQAVMTRLRIGPGAVRAAMSRLAADGWLTREKRGRNSYYALAKAGQHAFDLATRRIYAAGPADWSGDWTICILPEEAGEDRDSRRRALRDLGFGTVGPTVFLRPETRGAPDAARALSGAMVFSARGKSVENYAALAGRAWPLAAAAAEYAEIVATYTPLLTLLEAGAALAPLDAMAARTLLIHEFRRIVLKAPLLPAELRPPDWPEDTARDTAIRLYRALIRDSESWLDACDGGPDGPLPAAGPAFRSRFGGIIPLD